ncbi:MAG: translation elongation factor-like protein [Patescibacteria group bacterium]
MKKKITKTKKPRKTPKNNLVISGSRGKAAKPIGVVTHFYGGIEVAIMKFKKPVKAGSVVRIKGATTDFEQKIKSMQYDHKDVSVAKKGQEVGVKVDDKVRQGDEIFKL